MNFDNLWKTALAADRFGVSNRAATSIINAYQVDIGRITPEDMSNVVDAKNIWRARKKIRSKSAREAANAAPAIEGWRAYILTAEKIRPARGSPRQPNPKNTPLCKAVRHIQAARQRETEDVRTFRLPKFDFSDSSYS